MPDAFIHVIKIKKKISLGVKVIDSLNNIFIISYLCKHLLMSFFYN